MTKTGAATPFRPQFEQLAAMAEHHLQAIERICKAACELRDQMIDEFDIDPDEEAVLDAYDEVYGFNLLGEAMNAVGV